MTSAGRPAASQVGPLVPFQDSPEHDESGKVTVSGVYLSREKAHVRPKAKDGMRVVGKLKLSPWQRFVQLQRTTVKLTRGRGQPKGVFRFKPYEDVDRWTEAPRGSNATARRARSDRALLTGLATLCPGQVVFVPSAQA